MRKDISGQDLAKGTLAGLIGGLAGTWAMTQFQKLVSLKAGEEKAQESKQAQDPRESLSPTERVAHAISQSVRGRMVSRQHQARAGQLVHYGYGTVMGGVYGGLCEVFPQTAAGAGSAWGAVMWLGGDEVALPLFRLAGAPTSYPLSTHLLALAAHVVYGVTTHVACRGTRTLLDRGFEAFEPLRRTAERRREPEEEVRLDYAEFVATGV